jgi:hypothetical protein
MVADEANWLTTKMAELIADYGDREPTVYSFGAFEALWREVVEPKLGEFETMQESWAAEQSVPEDSRWYHNWRIPRG